MSRYQTVWTTSDGKEFEVTRVYMDEDGQTWVNYRNLKTHQTYICLRDAFVERFTQQVA